MEMNDTQYELLEYLERNKLEGRELMNLVGYPMDERMLLLAKSLIKTNADKSQGHITAFGIIALAKEKRRRGREVVGDVDPDEMDIEGESDFKRLSLPRPLPETQGRANDAELSEWEKQQMAILTPPQAFLLKRLRDMDADGKGVHIKMHHITRKTMQRYGWIKVDKSGRVWLLDAGRVKLEEQLGQVAPVQASVNGSTMEALSIPTLPATHGGSCEGACDECVHREVLDLIAAKYPNVGRLRDVLLEEKRLLNDLGLG